MVREGREGEGFPSFAQRRNVIQTHVPAIRSGLLCNKAPVAPQPERLEAAALPGLDEQVEHPANRHTTKPHWSPGSLGLAALPLTAAAQPKDVLKSCFERHEASRLICFRETVVMHY